jgi:hypothetical protein
MRHTAIATVILAMSGLLSCSSSGSGVDNAGGAAQGAAGNAAMAGSPGVSGTAAGGSSNVGGAGMSGVSGAAGALSGTAETNKGWLYTLGNKIYQSNGSAAGAPWMGRGVNLDDLFFCGYNYMLETQNAEDLLKTEIDGLFSAWKPNFVRMSLGMDSYPTKVSWLSDEAQYKTPMIDIIRAIGAHANTYVLVTLRSDVTMIGQDPGNPEPTGMPSNSSNTPDLALYPSGTDAVYVALVDSFAQDNFVLFGLTNEPGGNAASAATISAALSHAVTTIRTEEDRLGVPHHLVSVQGRGYSGDISLYAATPLAQDNVVYEVHGYPPPTSSYTYANIPVILGEYGSLDASSAPGFFGDLETKQISNLAWDFDPYSNCAPDLLNISRSATSLTPTDWGNLVLDYLTAHAAP